jgi:RNA polymerase sigma factor (sigma-70 family)
LLQDNPNIANLLKGCLNNDRNSQKGLYQILRKHAFAICYRYLDSQELSEQILNASFIQLFKQINKFDKSKYADIYKGVKTWLSRIVVLNCIDYYLQKRLFNHEPLLTEKLEHSTNNPENTLQKPSDQEIIDAIRKLPLSFRIVFNLAVIEGMSHKVIGDHLHIPTQRSRIILDNAREIMRKNLSGEYAQPWPEETRLFPAQLQDKAL